MKRGPIGGRCHAGKRTTRHSRRASHMVVHPLSTWSYRHPSLCTHPRPCFCLRCCTVPRARRRPAAMMPTRLHTASHSSMLRPLRGWANVGARGLGIEDACTLARRINPHGSMAKPAAHPDLWLVSSTSRPAAISLRMTPHSARRAPGRVTSRQRFPGLCSGRPGWLARRLTQQQRQFGWQHRRAAVARTELARCTNQQVGAQHQRQVQVPA